MVPLSVVGLTELQLTGKLDRIDIDTYGKAVRVVDYKTGKAKTRNDIEGKTAKGDASYRRQLSFYSLLLHLHGDDRYLTEEGVLSFIEADSKGKIHEEAYHSGEAERNALIEEINVAVTALLSGEFLSDRELLAQSDYEHLGLALLERGRY
jgi:RecB family exonuclease